MFLGLSDVFITRGGNIAGNIKIIGTFDTGLNALNALVTL